MLRLLFLLVVVLLVFLIVRGRYGREAMTYLDFYDTQDYYKEHPYIYPVENTPVTEHFDRERKRLKR